MIADAYHAIVLDDYITHILVIQYTEHRNTRPPADPGKAGSWKARYLIVSVQKSRREALGQIRLHKARENVNGSFSIGRT
jgi:hypothetical protein